MTTPPPANITAEVGFGLVTATPLGRTPPTPGWSPVGPQLLLLCDSLVENRSKEAPRCRGAAAAETPDRALGKLLGNAFK